MHLLLGRRPRGVGGFPQGQSGRWTTGDVVGDPSHALPPGARSSAGRPWPLVPGCAAHPGLRTRGQSPPQPPGRRPPQPLPPSDTYSFIYHLNERRGGASRSVGRHEQRRRCLHEVHGLVRRRDDTEMGHVGDKAESTQDP